MNQSVPKIITALMSALAVTSAQAIFPGTPLANGVIAHPYTGQPTDAWKLVGTMTYPSGDFCSAVQISSEWVVASGHCALEVGTVFKNALSTDPRGSVLTCDEPGESDAEHRYPYLAPFILLTDISMCRLDNPERFAAPTAFPALTSPPYLLAGVRPYGKELLVGTGSDTPSRDRLGRATFTTRTSSKYAICPSEHPFYFNQDNCILGLESGDSGGGRYWYSPYADAPAMIGILGAADFSQAVLDWVRARADKYSRLTPPRIVATSVAFGRPLTDVPGALPQPPAVKLNGRQVVVTWRAPMSVGEVVDEYRVYEGSVNSSGLTLARVLSVPSSAAPSATLTGVALGSRKVCVQARRQGVEASANTESNCTVYENVLPVAGTIWVSSAPVSRLFRTVTINWGVTPSATGAPIMYKVEYAIKYPSGLTKTAKTVLASTSLRVGLLNKGTQLCASVAAISSTGGSVPMPAQCFTID
jgi:hypothetical protein